MPKKRISKKKKNTNTKTKTNNNKVVVKVNVNSNNKKKVIKSDRQPANIKQPQPIVVNLTNPLNQFQQPNKIRINGTDYDREEILLKAFEKNQNINQGNKLNDVLGNDQRSKEPNKNNNFDGSLDGTSTSSQRNSTRTSSQSNSTSTSSQSNSTSTSSQRNSTSASSQRNSTSASSQSNTNPDDDVVTEYSSIYDSIERGQTYGDAAENDNVSYSYIYGENNGPFFSNRNNLEKKKGNINPNPNPNPNPNNYDYQFISSSDEEATIDSRFYSPVTIARTFFEHSDLNKPEESEENKTKELEIFSGYLLSNKSYKNKLLQNDIRRTNALAHVDKEKSQNAINNLGSLTDKIIKKRNKDAALVDKEKSQNAINNLGSLTDKIIKKRNKDAALVDKEKLDEEKKLYLEKVLKNRQFMKTFQKEKKFDEEREKRYERLQNTFNSSSQLLKKQDNVIELQILEKLMNSLESETNKNLTAVQKLQIKQIYDLQGKTIGNLQKQKTAFKRLKKDYEPLINEIKSKRASVAKESSEQDRKMVARPSKGAKVNNLFTINSENVGTVKNSLPIEMSDFY